MLFLAVIRATSFDVISPAFLQVSISMRRQRFTCVRLSHSYMPCLVHDFSVSFTTAAFGRSSIRLFEASTYIAGSEGPTLIFHTTRRLRAVMAQRTIQNSTSRRVLNE
jgi:hypothetical protein